MLYDQALLALAYLETFQITRKPLFARTAREIFSYVLRDMQADEGGFYSAEDADSEGEEGKFYIWEADDFERIVGPEDAADWSRVLNLRKDGNFHEEASGRKTGANILHWRRPPEELAGEMRLSEDAFMDRWEIIRRKLFDIRKKRIHPLKDDKILTDWNGLMIAALSRGARILGSSQYRNSAARAADFILNRMRDFDGRLRHRFREGEVAIAAHADDYAFLIFGLLELYHAGFETAYLESALALQQQMLDDFWDEKNDGFYSTSHGETELPVRPKELYDGALPSANSVSLLNLLGLSRLTGDVRWEERASRLVRAFSGSVQSLPSAFTFFLVGLDFALNPGQDVVIAGEPESADTLEMLAALNINFTPNGITMVKSNRNSEKLAAVAGYTDGLDLIEGKAVAHICRGGACRESTADISRMLQQLTVGDKEK